MSNFFDGIFVLHRLEICAICCTHFSPSAPRGGTELVEKAPMGRCVCRLACTTWYPFLKCAREMMQAMKSFLSVSNK